MTSDVPTEEDRLRAVDRMAKASDVGRRATYCESPGTIIGWRHQSRWPVAWREDGTGKRLNLSVTDLEIDREDRP